MVEKVLLLEGYKNTELGVIPQDWDIVKLPEVGKSLTGLTYNPDDVSDYGTLVLRSSNIQNGRLSFENNVFVKMDLPDRVIVKENDILICVRNGSKHLIGKCALIDKKTEGNAFGAFMSIFRAKSPKFLFFQFQSNIIQQQINQALGATINQITNKDLSSFQIPLPPTKAEQTAIATALSDMDALIEAQEKLISKKRLIKQGAMQELLTGKKRVLDINGQRYFKDWTEYILGQEADIYRGGSPRPIESYITSSPNGINWIKIGDVGKSAKYIDQTEEKIIPEGISRSRFVNEGDFLLSNSMSFGRPYILRTNGCIHDGWLVIQNYQNTFNKDFLYYILGFETVLLQYISMASGSTVLNLNKEIVKNVIINAPSSLEEQEAIATILSDMDTELDKLKHQLEKYQKVKTGMMQELLTGKKRLV